jgi:hypothetical protein
LKSPDASGLFGTMPFLVIQSGVTSGRRFELGYAPCLVGRDAKCQLVLNDPTISSRHATLWAADGLWYLADLRSMNGTFLNRQLVPPEKAVELRDGDALAFGSVLAKFVEAPDVADEALRTEIEAREREITQLKAQLEARSGWCSPEHLDAIVTQIRAESGPGRTAEEGAAAPALAAFRELVRGYVEALHADLALVRRDAEILGGYVAQVATLAQPPGSPAAPPDPAAIAAGAQAALAELKGASERSKLLLLDLREGLAETASRADLERALAAGQSFLGGFAAGAMATVKGAHALATVASSHPDATLFAFTLLREAADSGQVLACAASDGQVVFRLPLPNEAARERYRRALAGSGDVAARHVVSWVRAAGGRVGVGEALELVVPAPR